MEEAAKAGFGSSSLPAPRGAARLPPFTIEYYFKPCEGASQGGDQFRVRRGRDGCLWFFLGDASGHGDAGYEVWKTIHGEFEDAWTNLARGPCSATRLEHFAARVNDSLTRSEDPGTRHLCVAVGGISPAGVVAYAMFGYGAHVLVTSRAASWSPPSEAAFSLRLGWVPSSQWRERPGSVVVHQVDLVSRVILLSDGFLGDDYADVSGTLGAVRAFGEASAGLPLTAVVPHFDQIPHDRDDASLLVIELDSA